jgi:hypothetical protein
MATHFFPKKRTKEQCLHGVLDGFAGSCSRKEGVDGNILVLVLLV